MGEVTLLNKEDGFYAQFNNPLLNNKEIVVKINVHCKHLAEDLVVKLEELLQKEDLHSIKKYTEAETEFGEDTCNMLYEPAINDFINRVRRRPMVIFGSADKNGAINVIKSIISELLPYCEKIHLDIDEDGYISLIAENMHIYKLHGWRIKCRKAYQDTIEMCKAVTDELEVSVDVDGKLEKTKFISGKHVDTTYTKLSKFDKHNISLIFKISHEVFDYDYISKRDLNFIRIGVD